MNAPVLQDFSYDPFDPAVMADPLPYYRVLRDEHPVYFIEKWDTYALSRFSDIWQVLEINDGTFVASEGTLPAATVLAQRNDGPVPDPPLHPMPFHANFDAPINDGRAALHLGSVPAEIGVPTREPDPYPGQRTARRTVAARNIRPDAGVRRHRRRVGGMRIAGSAGRSRAGRAGHCQRRKPGSAGQRCGGRQRQARLSRVPRPDRATPPRRQRRRWVADRRQTDRLPIARRLRVQRHRSRNPDAGLFIGGTETVPKIVAHGLWELGRRPDQLAAIRADPEANVPVAREEMVRYCAPAQWFARTVRKPFAIHGTTIQPGQRIITLLASANRDEGEYTNPDDFVWNRPIERLLAFGRGQHLCLGVHLARIEIAVMVTEWLKRVDDWRIDSEAASRPPSSFQWGWNNIPVAV